MKKADIAIVTNGSGRLGPFSVESARFADVPDAGPQSPRLLRVIGAWLERRRQRRDLALLDDHMLKDVGLTRFDAVREAEKPFWQP